MTGSLVPLVSPSSSSPLGEEAVGSGPTVLLVHGVGVGPAALGGLASLIAGAGRRAVVVHRPGYGSAAGSSPLPVDRQVELLADLVSGSPVAGVVGVSGGATLALLLAVRLPGVPVVAHEPLLGPLVPALHHRVQRAVSALGPPGRAATAAAATSFVRRLVGEATWSRLPEAERAAVAGDAELVATEARAFAGVAVSAGDLARLRPSGRLTTTVGGASGPERRSAAGVLASLAGARVVTVPGAGHLAHVDAPDAFARLALAALDAA